MNHLSASWKKHVLRFSFEAKTSRDTLKIRPVWFILVKSENQLIAIGECAWLKGLSIEAESMLEPKLEEICKNIELFLADPALLLDWPSMQMAMDMIRAQLNSKSLLNPFPGDFSSGKSMIPINGLIWMGKIDFMFNSLKSKISEGYSCIKLKIGGIDFREELKLLEFIRNEFDENEIEIRLDANGAFALNEASDKLQTLSQFNIHSIEQPVKQGKWHEMAEIVSRSPIPVALDEELIGIWRFENKEELLKTIMPQYIILKPSLIGGFTSSEEWIRLAADNNIKWWLTSMLESNIGLNALAQWVSTRIQDKFPQGLGTGKLYTNNISCGLETAGGFIKFKPEIPWNLSIFEK